VLSLLLLIFVAALCFCDPLSAIFGSKGGFSSWAALPGCLWRTFMRDDVTGPEQWEFVLATQSIDTGNNKLILHHIPPNILLPITVSAMLGNRNRHHH